MSNRIAVMRDGQVEQIGRPRDVYQSPASRFVADFIGISNFVTGTITEQRAHTHVIDSEIGSIEVTSEAPFSRDDQVIVSIRPESLDLKPVDGDDRAAGLGGCSIGRIETRAFMGEAIDYIVDLGVTKVRARLNPSATFSTGDRVEVHVLSEGAALLSGSD
jgi:iron(III) transport system ATP-binding protein